MKKYIFILFMLSIGNITVADEGFFARKGVRVTSSNFMELVNSSLPLSVARSGQGGVEGDFVNGFLLVEEKKVVYSLGGASLYATSYPERQRLGVWRLSPDSIEDLEPEILDDDPQYSSYDRFNAPGAMGCMDDHPLRYGDVEGDGKSELFIFLSDDVSVNLLVFSTDKNKVIFSSKLDFNDVIENVDEVDPAAFEGPTKWQFWSKRGYFGQTYASMGASLKAFAKLYFGDFDGDGRFDIVMWRRYYESRKANDPVRGFELKSSRLMHYENTSGTYKLQSTAEQTVQSWLAGNSLTWRKGYPNASECPGHGGQLIPEMHDPLLNDPVVLN